MAEMAVQGLLEFWPCKSVNNPNFGLPIENLKYNEMLDPLGQAWPNGSASAA